MSRRISRRRFLRSRDRQVRQSLGHRNEDRKGGRFRLFGFEPARGWGSSVIAWFKGLTSSSSSSRKAERIGESRPLGQFEPLEARQLLATLTEGTTVEISDNHSVVDISVFPGKAGYDDGVDSGTFGDGTVLDYRFFNNTGTTFNGTGYADGGAGIVSAATATNSSNTNGGALDWADVWTSNDPDTAAANFTTDTFARSQGITGTIDISGLVSGSVDFIYGSFQDLNTVFLTMTGNGQPDLTAHHSEDPPGRNKAWTTNFTFADAALYDTISYSYTNADTDASRARFMGLIVDGVTELTPPAPGDIGIFIDTTGGETIARNEGDLLTHDFEAGAIRSTAGIDLNGTSDGVSLDAGHYLVMYDSLFNSSGGSERREIQSKLNLASNDLPIGWSQAYIRRQNGQNEAITTGAGIIDVANDGDLLRLQSFRTDDENNAVTRGTQTALQVLKLDDSWDYLRIHRSADQTGPIDQGIGNAVEVTYNSIDETNANFGFTSGDSNITLTKGGKYLVVANTYFTTATSDTDRHAFTQRLTLDNTEITGSRTGVFVRGNANGDSTHDGAAAIATIIDATAGQQLSVDVSHDPGNNSPGDATIKADMTALTIVKLPDNGAYIGLTETAGTQDINDANAVTWGTQVETPDASFAHTPGTSAVSVGADDDYLFLSTLYTEDTGATRGYPESFFDVNDTAATFGRSGFYTRNMNDGSGDGQSGGNFNGILLALNNGDSVELETNPLGGGGTMHLDHGGFQGLRLSTLFAASLPPEITDLEGDLILYEVGAAAAVIDDDSDAGVTDLDSADFDSGSLTVEITDGLDSANDQLGISTAGNISLAGNDVIHGGNTIGTISSDGTGGNPLTITLTADATHAAMTDLVRSITFENGNMNTGPTREVTFTVADGDGATTSVASNIGVVTSLAPEDVIWDGGGTSDDWNDRFNWLSDMVPDFNDTAVFPAPVTVDIEPIQFDFGPNTGSGAIGPAHPDAGNPGGEGTMSGTQTTWNQVDVGGFPATYKYADDTDAAGVSVTLGTGGAQRTGDSETVDWTLPPLSNTAALFAPLDNAVMNDFLTPNLDNIGFTFFDEIVGVKIEGLVPDTIDIPVTFQVYVVADDGGSADVDLYVGTVPDGDTSPTDFSNFTPAVVTDGDAVGTPDPWELGTNYARMSVTLTKDDTLVLGSQYFSFGGAWGAINSIQVVPPGGGGVETVTVDLDGETVVTGGMRFENNSDGVEGRDYEIVDSGASPGSLTLNNSVDTIVQIGNGTNTIEAVLGGTGVAGSVQDGTLVLSNQDNTLDDSSMLTVNTGGELVALAGGGSVLGEAEVMLDGGQLSVAADATAGGAVRFVQVIETAGTDTRFHLSELEVFESGVAPNNAGGGSFGGLTTSTNDIGDGTLTAYGVGNLVPTVGTTNTIQHGAANQDPDNVLQNAGNVWSTQNNQATRPQYTLDLGDTFDVARVRAWPRADTCCNDRWGTLEFNLYEDDGTGNPGNMVATTTIPRPNPTGNVPHDIPFNLTTPANLSGNSITLLSDSTLDIGDGVGLVNFNDLGFDADAALTVDSGRIEFQSATLTENATLDLVNAPRLTLSDVTGSSSVAINGDGSVLLPTENPTFTPTAFVMNGPTVELAADNALTGNPQVNAGLLLVTGDSDISQMNPTLNGGLLESDGDNALGDVTLDVAGEILVSQGTLTAGAVGGAGDLDKTGPGTLAVTGSGNYTGTATVNGGVLRLDGPGALGGPAAGATVTSGTQLELVGGVTVDFPLDLAGAGTNGVGALVNVSGTNTVNGDVSFAADTTIGSTAGDLTINGDVDLDWRNLAFDGNGDTLVTGDISNGSYGELVLSTGPEAYWRFEEAGGPAVADSSPNGHNGTAINTPTFGVADTPDTGTALNFNGNNERVDITGYKGITGLTPRTIAAWIRTTDNDGGIVAFGRNTAGDKFTFRVQNDNGLVGAIRVEVNGGYKVSDVAVDDGQWHHVAVTWEDDGSPNVTDAKLYVDGVETGNSAERGRSLDGDGTVAGIDVRIGRTEANGGAAHLNGDIDEVGIWERVLTPQEIAALGAGGPANSVSKLGTGTVTLTGDNTYNGDTTVERGLLIAGSDSALGDAAGETIVEAGGTVGLQGVITLSEPLSIRGDGDTGEGALVNISDDNTYEGALDVAGDAGHIGAQADTLTMAGTIDLGTAADLVIGGDGDVEITGQITSGSGPAPTTYLDLARGLGASHLYSLEETTGTVADDAIGNQDGQYFTKIYNVDRHETDTEVVIDYSGNQGGDFPVNLPTNSINSNGPGGGGGRIANRDDFSVRAQTYLRFNQAGTYSIALGSEEGRWLTLTGEGATPDPTFTDVAGPHNGGGVGNNFFHDSNTGGREETRAVFDVANAGDVFYLDAWMFERGGNNSFELSIKAGNDTSHGGPADGWVLIEDKDNAGATLDIDISSTPFTGGGDSGDGLYDVEAFAVVGGGGSTDNDLNDIWEASWIWQFLYDNEPFGEGSTGQIPTDRRGQPGAPVPGSVNSMEIGPWEVINTANGMVNNWSEFTFAGWFLLTDDTPGGRDLFGQSGAVELYFQDNNTIRLWAERSNANNTDVDLDYVASTLGTDLRTDRQWHHIAAVGTGSQKQIFIDGVLVRNHNHNALPADGYGDSTSDFSIGADVRDNTDNHFQGNLDEIAVFPHALSAASIADLAMLTPLAAQNDVTKTGTGTLTLSSANTYNGQTIINDGTVIANTNGSLGLSGSATLDDGTVVTDGATLVLEGGITVGDDLALQGNGDGGAGALRNQNGNSTVVDTASLTLTGNARITTATDTLNIGADMDLRDGSLDVRGDGDTVLAGDISGLPNLQGHWTFDDGASPTADSSGRGRDGTLVGNATFALGHDGVGQSIQLDGAGDYVEAVGYDGVLGNTPRTVAAWIKADSGSPNDMYIMTWGTNPPATNGARWAFRLNDGGGGKQLRMEINNAAIITNTTIPENEWHHVVAVLPDATNATIQDIDLYIDGVQQTTYNANNNNYVVNTLAAWDVKIGSREDPANGLLFQGQIDEAMIYSTELSDSEIGALYLNELPTGTAISKNGAGNLTLSGDNTYAGETIVMAGTLVAASDNALGNTDAGTTVSDRATLALSNAHIPAGDASGNVEIPAGESLTLGHLAVVADYRDDFQDGSLPAGWQYLWNAPSDWDAGDNPGDYDPADGPISDVASYRPLVWSGTQWTSDGDDTGTNSNPDRYVKLSATDGHPGAGASDAQSDVDRYAIAAYTVSQAGFYEIADSFVTNTNAQNSNGGQIRVAVNDTELFTVSYPNNGTVRFDGVLGYLDVGDVIYVAQGPNGAAGSDGFAWDFSISTTGSPTLENLAGNNTYGGDISAQPRIAGEIQIASSAAGNTLTVDGDVDLQESQLTASGAGDTVVNGVILSTAPGITVVGEVGQFSVDQDATETIDIDVPFSQAFPAVPIVIAQPPSTNGSDDVIVRITEVTTTGFTAKILEPPKLDGSHGEETISFVALLPGLYTTSGGARLEAGSINTAATTHGAGGTGAGQFVSVPFAQTFTGTPAVMSQVQTNNDPHFVKTRQQAASSTAFLVAMEEEEDQTANHGFETIGYVAIEQSVGTWNGLLYEADITPNAVVENNYTINFAAPFTGPPRFIGAIATHDGADPSELRYLNLTATSVDVFVEEDTSQDGEVGHGDEEIAYLAIEGDGLLLDGVIPDDNLYKTGAGTLTLNSGNTYGGTTTVSQGTLDVDGMIGATSPGGPVMVEAGALLTGTGNVNAPIDSLAGSTIQPEDGMTLGDGSDAGFATDGALLVDTGVTATLADSGAAELGEFNVINGTLELAGGGMGVQLDGSDNLSGTGTINGTVIIPNYDVGFVWNRSVDFIDNGGGEADSQTDSSGSSVWSYHSVDSGGESGGPDTVTLLDDHFDNGDIATDVNGINGGFHKVSNSGGGAGTVTESGTNAVEVTTGGNDNTGIVCNSPLDIAGQAPDGIKMTFVITDISADPATNGMFLGLQDDSTTFFRNVDNFGLVFSGTENRTSSSGGFGLVTNDNGNSGADTVFDHDDLQLTSLQDGFTAVITADETGWSYEITGVNDTGGAPATFSNSGTWVASGEAATFYADFFDNAEHVAAYVQQNAGVTTRIDRITVDALGTGGGGGGSILDNGGFDDYDIPVQTDIDDNTPVSWIANNGEPHTDTVQGDITGPQAGTHFFKFQSNNPSYIYQTFNTVSGTTYNLSFYSARPQTNNTNFSFDVDVFDGAGDPGNVASGDLLDQTVGNSAVTGGTWTPFNADGSDVNFQFTATSGQSTLRFLDAGTGGVDPSIDTVTVTAVAGGDDGGTPLKVDFSMGTDAPLQTGFEGFSSPDGTATRTQTYANDAATDGTIDVTISGMTHWRTYATITAGPFLGQSDLLRDGPLRNADGTMTLTLGDLKAGEYEITTYHHNTEFGPGDLTLSLTDALVTAEQKFSGTTTGVHGQPDSRQPTEITTVTFSFVSNGSDDVVIDMTMAGPRQMKLNGFELQAVPTVTGPWYQGELTDLTYDAGDDEWEGTNPDTLLIDQTALQQDSDPANFGETPVLVWTNPTGGPIEVDLGGNLQIDWFDQSYDDIVQSMGPEAYYRFEETSGNTVADSANGHDGVTVNSPDLTIAGTGTLGSAIHLDGADNDSVNITGYKGVTGLTARTISAWIRTTDTEGGIVAYGTNTTGNKFSFRIQAGNGPAGAIRAEVNGGYRVSDIAVNDGQWHHVAMTWEDDGSPNITDVKLYVDGGERTHSNQQSQGMGTNGTVPGIDVRIGRTESTNAPLAHLDGDLDEVSIFSRALSAQEIALLHAASDYSANDRDVQYVLAHFDGSTWNELAGDTVSRPVSGSESIAVPTQSLSLGASDQLVLSLRGLGDAREGDYQTLTDDLNITLTQIATTAGAVVISPGDLAAADDDMVATSDGSPAGDVGEIGTLSTFDVTLSSNTTLDIDLDDPDYDSLAVTGTVTLGDAALDLDYTAGDGPFVIVDNDGTDAVVGEFAGLADGDTVFGGGKPFAIDYQYDLGLGVDGGNDVALFINPNPEAVFSGEALLRLDSTGTLLQLFVDNDTDNLLNFDTGDYDPDTLEPLLNLPSSFLSTLTITSGAATDRLAVDVGNGLIDFPFTYNGGGGTLILRGDPQVAATEEFHAEPAVGDESITITPTAGTPQVITLTDVGRVIDTVPVTSVVITATTGADTMSVGLGTNSGTALVGGLPTTEVMSDTFTTLEGSIGNRPSQLIDGREGFDELSLVGLGPQDIELTGPGTIDGFQGPGFDNINNLVGAPGSTLIGGDVDTLWEITADDEGTITAEGRSMDFAGFGSLIGGSANDTFDFSDGATLSGTVDGGLGIDTLDYADYTTGVVVDLSNNTAQGATVAPGGAGDPGSSIENVFGGAGNDAITGDDDENLLRDGLGSDVLNGLGGNDRYQLQPDPAGTSNDYVMDGGESDGDWVDFSQAGIAPNAPGVTIDMDLVGWDSDGVVNVNDPQGSIDDLLPDNAAIQDVYQGSTVTLLNVGPDQALPADSPFENVLGSPGNDDIDIDPTDGIRYVDGGGGNDNPLQFDSGGSAIIDNGQSITAEGIGTVVYINIPVETVNTAPRIIDDGDIGFSTTGNLGRSPMEGYLGDERFFAPGNGSNVATWTFNGVTPGLYHVSVTWMTGGNRTRDALFNVLDGTTEANSTNAAGLPGDERPIKQRVAPLGFRDEGAMWQDLTNDDRQPLFFEITGNTLVVELPDTHSADYAMADAVRIERVNAGEAEVRVLEGTGLHDVTSGQNLTDLGTVDTDGSSEQFFRVQNIGLTDLSLSLQDVPGGFTADLSATNVAPGDTAFLTVTLQSDTAGRYNGTLLLGTNDSDENPFEIDLTGLVRAALPQTGDDAIIAEDEPDPTGRTEFEATRPFRYIRRDTRMRDNDGWASRDQGGLATWTIHDLTPGQAYQVSAAWPGGENAATNAPFRVYGGNTLLLEEFENQSVASNDFEDGGDMWESLGTFTLPQGATSITVDLSDEADGYVFADAIHVVPLVAGEIAVYEVPDVGQATELVDQQSAVDFGFSELLPTDAARVTKTFEIVNEGSGDLTLTQPISLPLGFTLSQAPGATVLAPGDSTTLVISVDAAAPGPVGGEVVVESSDADETLFEFAVTANIGVKFADNDDVTNDTNSTNNGFRRAATPQWFGGDVRYDSAGVGNNWVDWEITGLTPGANYAVSATWLQGYASNATYEIYGGAPNGNLAGSATVDQRFAPNDFQDANHWWEELAIVQTPGDPQVDSEATLTVRLTDDADNWVYADAIRVQQVYLPEVEVSIDPVPPETQPDSIESGEGVDFGSLSYLASAGIDMTLANTGLLPLEIGDVNLTGTGFTLTGLADQSLAPGGSINFNVAFDTGVAMNVDTYNGEITFTTNDVDETSFSIPLTARLSNETLVDNGDDGFRLTGNNPFTGESRDTTFHNNDFHYHVAGSGQNTAEWVIGGLAPGVGYRIWTTWAAGETRAPDAPFTAIAATAGDPISIFNGRPVLATTVNQQVEPNVDEGSTRWQALGIVSLLPGETTLAVQLSDGASSGVVVADAVRIEQLERPEVEVEVDGVPVLTGSQIDYGQLLQLTPAAKEVTITNVGLQDLDVSLPTLDVDTDFSLTGWAGGTLARGVSETLTLTLDTSARGFGAESYADLLQFTTNDADEPVFSLDLAGSVSSFAVVDSSAETSAFRLLSINGANNPFLGPIYDTRYHNGDYLYHPEGVGHNLVQWIYTGLTPGESYQVGVTWVGGGGRATDAPFTVRAATGSEPADIAAGRLADSDTVDQSQDPAGPIGWHTFDLVTLAGTEDTIAIQLTDGASGNVIADAAIIIVPQPLHAAEASPTPAPPLSPEAIAPALGEAASLWTTAGLTPAETNRLSRANVQIADLSGTKLGLASQLSGTVWIDTDAAGHGWDSQDLRAKSGEPEAGRMDLLTVLAHELGHVIGREHGDDHEVMSPTLDAGVRVLPGFEESGVRGQESDLWSAFADLGTPFHIPHSALRTPHSSDSPLSTNNPQSSGSGLSALDSPLRDSLFARLDNADLDEEDRDEQSDEDSKDALDLWTVLYGLE